MTAHTVDMKQFPVFSRASGTGLRCEMIAIFLENLLKKERLGSGDCVFIPSLSSLARFFKVSQMDVHDALQILRAKGYDYLLKGMDYPLTFWKTAE